MSELKTGARRRLRAIERLVREVARAEAAGADRVRLANRIREEAERLLAELVRAARREGATWQEIGDQLGLPRQTVHRRYGRKR